MLKSVIAIHAAIVCLCMAVAGCGPTAEDILKKYDTYGEHKNETGKSNVYFEMTGSMPMIRYSLPLLNNNEEYIRALAGRWFVADAENPTVKLPARIGLTTINATVNGLAQPVSYGHLLSLDSIKTRYLLIGFEGIGSIESAEAEIPPLFFLVENKGIKSKVLTPIPKLAGELFQANYKPMFFSEQEYSGEIPFEKSKNVVLHLTLSADLKKITQLKLSVESMYLTPANFDKQRKQSEQESIFKYLENSKLRTSFADQTVSASGYLVVSELQLNGGGLETTSSIDVIDGKVVLAERPLICDLTVTNACVYGTIKVEMEGGGTQSTYTVFKNITTPQDIPENILK